MIDAGKERKILSIERNGGNGVKMLRNRDEMKN